MSRLTALNLSRLGYYRLMPGEYIGYVGNLGSK